MIRLISIDLDGTTLDSGHNLPAENRLALQEAMTRGIKVVVNTGRHYTAALAIAKEIGVNAPLISNNGARITDINTGELLYHCPLTQEQVLMVATECRKRGWASAASLNSVVYSDTMPAAAQKWLDDGYPIDIRITGAEYYQGKQEADSMLVLVDAPEIYCAQDALQGKFGDELHIVISMPPCMDVMSMAAGKGKSLIWLAESYGIKHEEIFAIGDSFNDIDMLQSAGIGVAVGNAHAALKEVADHVTAGHEAAGVAKAIRKFVFLEKGQ
ncbi:MAG: Cof-type HAD-IIB family hydrolase [Negativicutes bacterium]|jgi:hypothetical protein